MTTGTDADALSASYAEGRRDERKEHAMTLREKVARKLFEQIFPTVADHEGRWEQEKPKLLDRADAILALLSTADSEQQEVVDLRRKLADTESSRDSWMHDFSVLATRMDKLVSLLAVAEKRVDRNITQIKERISRELCLWIGMGEIEDTTRDSRKYILEETDRLYSMFFEPEEHFPVDGPNANEANEILGKPGYYK